MSTSKNQTMATSVADAGTNQIPQRQEVAIKPIQAITFI